MPAVKLVKCAEFVTRMKAAKAGAAPNTRWWFPMVRIDITTIRPAKNNTSFFTIYYMEQPLKFKAADERICGNIVPTNEKDCAELSAKYTKVVKPRSIGNAQVQIQKYKVAVECESDGFTVKVDANKNPIYPADEFRSTYFGAIELLDEIFYGEMSERLAIGNAYAGFLCEKIVAGATIDVLAAQFAALPLYAAFAQKFGLVAFASNQLLIADDVLKPLKAKVRSIDKDRFKELTSAIINPNNIVSNPKIVRLYQSEISAGSPKSGEQLSNPITRISLPFESAKEAFIYVFDKEGNPVEAMVDGGPITNHNVHKLVTSGCIITGAINVGSVCISQMGVSIPTKIVTCTLIPAVSHKITLKDLLDDDDDDVDDDVKVEVKKEEIEEFVMDDDFD